MHHTPQQLEGLIDLLVETVLREMESDMNKNADESGQQRRRLDQASETLPHRKPNSEVQAV